MENVPLSDILGQSSDDDRSTMLVLYSLSECEPCETALEALRLVERENPSHTIKLVKIDRNDKKELGRAVMNGISKFPRIDLINEGAVLGSIVGIGSEESAETLKMRILELGRSEQIETGVRAA